jgi:hypothetical protein
LLFPEGLALNSAGTSLYVADPNSEDVRLLQTTSPYTSTLVGKGGEPPPTLPAPGPSGQNAINGYTFSPEYVAVVPSNGASYPNDLFMTDSGTGGVADVLVFNYPTIVNGDAVTYWNGQIGTSASPAGIATDGTTVYVADSGNDQIEAYNVNGVFNNAWKTDNNPDGRTAFSQPQGIALDSALGEIFIADTGNNRVVEMTTSGLFKASWGTSGLGTVPGGGPSTFSGPAAIAVDGAVPPNVFVADSGNKRVLQFKGF